MTDQRDDEISVLDMAVFLAEHWIFIFLIPAALAVVAFFLAGQLDRGHTASATINLPGAAVRKEAHVIPTMVAEMIYFAEQVESEAINVITSPNSITISATAQTSASASAMVRSAIGEISAVATQSIDDHAERVAAIAAYVERLTDIIERTGNGEVSADAVATAAELRNQASLDARDIEIARGVLTKIEETSVSQSPAGRSPMFYALLVLLFAGMFATAICSVVAMVRSARNNEGSRAKFDRILAAFGVKPKPSR